MKRFISIIVSLAMLATMAVIPSVTASADGVSVSANAGSDYTVDVTVSGTYDAYQVWLEKTYDGTSGWEIVKTYSDEVGETFSYQIPVENRTTNGIYSLFVRAKQSGEIVYAQEQVVAFATDKAAISAVTVGGEAIVGDYYTADSLSAMTLSTESAATFEKGYRWFIGDSSEETGYKLVAETKDYLFTPAVAGTYTFRVTVYEKANPANAATKQFYYVAASGDADSSKIVNSDIFSSLEATVGGGIIADFAGKTEVSEGATVNYKYGYTEPNVGRINGTGYVVNTSYNLQFAYPGVYAVSAYITTNNNNTFDDGIIRVANVSRADGSVISATVSEEGKVKNVGDTVKITANGTATGAYDGGYLYSFWRTDANGTVQVKAWSTDNTLTWSPAKNGHYAIKVRVKGADIPVNEGSYEYEKTLEYYVGTDAAIENLSLSTSVASGEATEKGAVTLTATSNSEDLLYKFVVNDELLGTSTIRGFSPDPTTVWVPRRDGNYTLKVVAMNKNSFGKGDVTTVINDYVVNEAVTPEVAVDITEILNSASYWSGDAEVTEAADGGLTFTKTEKGQTASALAKMNFTDYPILDAYISAVSGGALHVQMIDKADPTGTVYWPTGGTLTNAAGVSVASMMDNAPGRGVVGIQRMNLQLGTMKCADDGVTYNDPGKLSWKGEKEFYIYITCEAASAGSSITISKFDPVGYNEDSVNMTFNESTPQGLVKYRDFNSVGKLNFNETGMQIRATQGRAWTTIAVDIDINPIVEVTVPKVTGTAPAMFILIDDGAMYAEGGAVGDIFGPYITAAGTYRVNLGAMAAQRADGDGNFEGKKTFFIQFAMACTKITESVYVSEMKMYEPVAAIGTKINNWYAQDPSQLSVTQGENESLVLKGAATAACNTTGITYNVSTHPFIEVVVDSITDNAAGAGMYLLITFATGRHEFIPIALNGGFKVTQPGTYYFDVEGIGVEGLQTFSYLYLALEGQCTVNISKVEPVTEIPGLGPLDRNANWAGRDGATCVKGSNENSLIDISGTTGRAYRTSKDTLNVSEYPYIKVTASNHTGGGILFMIDFNDGKGDNFSRLITGEYYIDGDGTYIYNIGALGRRGTQSVTMAFGFDNVAASCTIDSVEFLTEITDTATITTDVSNWSGKDGGAVVAGSNAGSLEIGTAAANGSVSTSNVNYGLSAYSIIEVDVASFSGTGNITAFININGEGVQFVPNYDGRTAINSAEKYYFDLYALANAIGNKTFEFGFIVSNTDTSCVINSITPLSVVPVSAPVYIDNTLTTSADFDDYIASKPEAYYDSLTLPAIFADGMVMQRDDEIYVYGYAPNGETVSVKMDNGTPVTTTSSDDTGAFIVALPAMSASYNTHTMTVTCGSETITYNDILIGEVFLCGGQSNMELPFNRTDTYQDFYTSKLGTSEIPENANVKQFRVEIAASGTEVTDVVARGWETAEGDNFDYFAPLSFFFADQLQRELDIPVAVVVSAAGGSAIQYWLTAEGQKNVAYDVMNEMMANRGSLFNKMIAPILPYTYKSVLWYQGCANASYREEEQYDELQQLLVAEWRRRMYDGEKPFYIMELASLSDDRFVLIRDSQLKGANAQSGVTLIPNFDLGDAGDIHPRKKKLLAARLLDYYLADLAGQPIYAPEITDATVSGDSIILTFKNVYDGLTTQSGTVKGFKIAGSNKTYYDATATIIAPNQVKVTSASVSSPATVRFCYVGYCEADLYNSLGIPPYPFRTDTWELKVTGTGLRN